MIYYTSLLEANREPFDLLSYSTDGHLCQGLFAVMSLPFAVFQRDYVLFNVWLTVFGTISVIAFYWLIWIFSHGRAGRAELALITALFAFHPSVLASMTHFNPDIGVVTFFLCLWLCLVKGRTLLATLFALLLLLSKETAFLLLPLPFLFCLCSRPVGERVHWARENLVTLLAPYGAVGVFLLYKTVIREQPAFWGQIHDSSPWETVARIFTPDEMLMNFLVMVLVMNFNWVLSALGLGLAAALAFKRRVAASEAHARTLLLYFLCACVTAVLLLVRPYTNVRYVMLVFPLLILCLWQCSLALAVPRPLRIAAAVMLLGLFGVENFKTIDPLSRAYFGTFAFGKHTLLAAGRQTREPGGYGRDQLAYNLEFLKFPELVAAALRDLRPTPETVILSPQHVTFDHDLAHSAIFTTLDSRTYDVTFETNNSFLPRYSILPDLLKLPELPGDVLYFAFPNCDTSRELEKLSGLYPETTSKVYDRDGYQLEVFHFRQRSELGVTRVSSRTSPD